MSCTSFVDICLIPQFESCVLYIYISTLFGSHDTLNVGFYFWRCLKDCSLADTDCSAQGWALMPRSIQYTMVRTSTCFPVGYASRNHAVWQDVDHINLSFFSLTVMYRYKCCYWKSFHFPFGLKSTFRIQFNEWRVCDCDICKMTWKKKILFWGVIQEVLKSISAECYIWCGNNNNTTWQWNSHSYVRLIESLKLHKSNIYCIFSERPTSQTGM